MYFYTLNNFLLQYTYLYCKDNAKKESVTWNTLKW